MVAINVVNRPTAEQVAYRALCLGARVLRAQFEAAIQIGRSIPVLREIRICDQRVRDWLTEQGLCPHQSAREREVLGKRLGSWTVPETVESLTCVESLGILMWAMEPLWRIPPYDIGFADVEVLESVPVAESGSIRPFVVHAQLRCSRQILEAFEVAQVWLARARIHFLQENGADPPPGFTYDQLVSDACRFAREAGIIETTIEGDFPANGGSYAKLEPVDAAVLSAIAFRRHHALAWLRGDLEEWDIAGM